MNAQTEIELIRGVFVAGRLRKGVFQDQLVTLISDRLKATFSDLESLERDLSFLILVARCVRGAASASNPVDEKSAVLKILVLVFPKMTQADVEVAAAHYETIVEHGLVKSIPRLTRWWYALGCGGSKKS